MNSFTQLDPSVPAVVLKLVRDRYGHGRLGAVRTLGRLGVPVYLVDELPRTPVGRSRFATTIAWHMDANPALETLERLRSLGARIGGRPVLVATDDVSTLFLDTHGEQLDDMFRFPRQPPGLAARLADKGQLFELCHRIGIPTPQCTFPRSRADVEAFVETAPRFPVVVKSMDPRLLRRRPRAVSVFIARDRHALLAAFDEMEDFAHPNLMIQEFIPGGSDTIWMFNGYFDDDSECRFAACGRKLRQHPPDTGPATLGLCESNDEVEHATRRFMKELGYRGIVDMGYRFDARDGTYKLLDVNPRMGSTFRLFVDRATNDVVRAMYCDLTGQSFEPAEPAAGRKWVVEPSELWSARTSISAGKLSWGQWIRSIRGVDEAAWFALDDLAPFAAMTREFARDSWLGIQRRMRAAASGPSAVE